MSGAFQSTIDNYGQLFGPPGSKYGSGHAPPQHRKNDAVLTAGVNDLTFAAVNSTLYTIELNGQVITFTSDASATAQEIRDGLAAAIATAAAAFPTSPANYVALSEPVAATLRITESDPENNPVPVTESDANITNTVVTAHADTEPMDSGIGVFDGPAFGTIRANGAAAAFAGIVEHGQYYGTELETFDSEFQYPANSQVPVGRRGPYVVTVEDAPAVGDSVFVRLVAGAGGATKGAFRTDNDGGTAVDISAVASWRQAASNGRAVLEINLP